MKTLYLDFGMGVAGDMLTGALLDLIDDKDAVISEFNSFGLPGVTVSYKPSIKCGITGVKAVVEINGEEEGEHHHDHSHEHEHHHDHDHEHHHDHDHGHHHHNGVHDIEHIVMDHMNLSDKVKSDIMAVFGSIADAESKVHGMPIDEVHFHEVGTMDAICDVAMVCMLMDKIGADRVVATPINTGSGKVKCAHGILPVPAPATALILNGIPSYSNDIKSELCTPTGAALAKHFVTEFGSMPVMVTERIGYGMGNKDFEVCNAVRAILGTEGGSACAPNGSITELECNIDDMTGEALGFAMDRILEAGAVDVYYTPIIMKKSRPAIKVSVLCKEAVKPAVLEAMFRHLSTIGIRECVMNRYELARSVGEVETAFGKVRCKKSEGYGVSKCKLEYDDLAEVAKAQGISIEEVRNSIK